MTLTHYPGRSSGNTLLQSLSVLWSQAYLSFRGQMCSCMPTIPSLLSSALSCFLIYISFDVGNAHLWHHSFILDNLFYLLIVLFISHWRLWYLHPPSVWFFFLCHVMTVHAPKPATVLISPDCDCEDDSSRHAWRLFSFFWLQTWPVIVWFCSSFCAFIWFIFRFSWMYNTLPVNVQHE